MFDLIRNCLTKLLDNLRFVLVFQTKSFVLNDFVLSLFHRLTTWLFLLLLSAHFLGDFVKNLVCFLGDFRVI